MSRLVKGNYALRKKIGKPAKKKISTTEELFESRALEKLGGSIAFVMKADKFLWSDDDKTKQR